MTLLASLNPSPQLLCFPVYSVARLHALDVAFLHSNELRTELLDCSACSLFSTTPLEHEP